MKQIICISCLILLSLIVCSCNKDLLDSPVDEVFEQVNGRTRSMEARTRSNPSSTGNKWAIIINGGGDKYSNHICYWNDCSFFYKTL